jgi:hypothetical protein
MFPLHAGEYERMTLEMEEEYKRCQLPPERMEDMLIKV